LLDPLFDPEHRGSMGANRETNQAFTHRRIKKKEKLRKGGNISNINNTNFKYF
jgi:hypothetical protein